jgi:hypothetical protein
MHEFAEDFGAVLGREGTYVPEEVDTWNETYVDAALAEIPHAAEHMKTLTRLIGGGGYRGVGDQLRTLLGRPPKTVRWALGAGRWRTILASRSWRPAESPSGRTAVMSEEASGDVAGICAGTAFTPAPGTRRLVRSALRRGAGGHGRLVEEREQKLVTDRLFLRTHSALITFTARTPNARPVD